MVEILTLFFIVSTLVFIFFYFIEKKKTLLVMSVLEEERTKSKGVSVKYGKMSEHFFPFLKKYPYNRERFRFIGTPIDGVQFDDDKIVIVEFKTGKSRLSERQKKVKELVDKGKVEFKEFRL